MNDEGKTISKPEKRYSKAGGNTAGRWVGLIRYDRDFDRLLRACASAKGQTQTQVLDALEHGIRTRHNEARVEHPANKANSFRPDVYTLQLKEFCVYFSHEGGGVLIRGLGWEIDHEPLDDFDGGGFWGN